MAVAHSTQRLHSLAARLEANISPEPNTGCWLWLASVNGDGYAMVRGDDGKTRSAHKAMWELQNSVVPVGLELDHRCRVRSCVNPDHLEVVTLAEHRRRTGVVGIAARPGCRHGHPLTGLNLMLSRDGHGRTYRRCRKCFNAYRREARKES